MLTSLVLPQVFNWPYVGKTGNENVELINSNLGDYRNVDRFHLGIDIQEVPNTIIYPVTTSQLIADPVYVHSSNDDYWNVFLQHGDVESGIFEPLDSAFSVYIHLIDYNQVLEEGYTVGPIGDEWEEFLADGDNLQSNHLHF